jgi:hypothetical protein
VKNGDIRVFLLGESPGGFHFLRKSLERRHCRCRMFDSYEEAQRLLDQEMPDIVLSAIPPRPGAIVSMTDHLAGTRASFYYACPVENGCWWLPALHRGERCFGAPAMRPAKFSGLLDQVVELIRGERERRRKKAARPIPIRAAHSRKPEVLALTKAAG